MENKAPKEIYFTPEYFKTISIRGQYSYKGDIKYISESHVKELLSEKDKEIEILRGEIDEALASLCCMYNQYCNGQGGHVFMSAGEDAVEILEKHKLFNEKTADGQGEFTEKAIKLMGYNPNE